MKRTNALTLLALTSSLSFQAYSAAPVEKLPEVKSSKSSTLKQKQKQIAKAKPVKRSTQIYKNPHGQRQGNLWQRIQGLERGMFMLRNNRLPNVEYTADMNAYELGNLYNEIAYQDERVTAVNTRALRNTNKIKNQKNRISNNANAISRMQSEVSELQMNLDNGGQGGQRLKARVNELASQVMEFDSRLRRIEELLDEAPVPSIDGEIISHGARFKRQLNAYNVQPLASGTQLSLLDQNETVFSARDHQFYVKVRIETGSFAGQKGYVQVKETDFDLRPIQNRKMIRNLTQTYTSKNLYRHFRAISNKQVTIDPNSLEFTSQGKLVMQIRWVGRNQRNVSAWMVASRDDRFRVVTGNNGPRYDIQDQDLYEDR